MTGYNQKGNGNELLTITQSGSNNNFVGIKPTRVGNTISTGPTFSNGVDNSIASIVGWRP